MIEDFSTALGRWSSGVVPHRILYVMLGVAIIAAAAVVAPKSTADPAASPEDRALEDLSRYEYPSLKGIRWKAHFVRPQDSLERLFGKDWVAVARFNRIDRRHVYPGMTIKVPENMEEIRNYTPLPAVYEPARQHAQYIYLSVTEQWLGAYEYGKLVFSMPAATGIEGHLAPTGLFKAEAYHRKHASSLYKTAKGNAQYPMDYAIRFLIDKEQVSYWIHARDLPGRPASHGCIGVFDEAMQNRVYGVPDKPVLEDAKKLYTWTIGEALYAEDDGTQKLLPDGPPIEIVGDLPKRLPRPPR
ncbi:MAG: L,D-transpeptidase family protein [Deltaproteobacteria bacterium]|nr:L,D-transpeptidase family protein [Deltaproteobacteria bacterium]